MPPSKKGRRTHSEFVSKRGKKGVKKRIKRIVRAERKKFKKAKKRSGRRRGSGALGWITKAAKIYYRDGKAEGLKWHEAIQMASQEYREQTAGRGREEL